MIIRFNIGQVVAHLLSWAVIAPVLDILIYGEPANKVFVQGLADFRLTNGDTVIAPLYDDAHFSLPAYLLQWSHVGEKWEVLEYIMLDDANHTAVFVYTMSELENVEKHSSYTVTPSDMHFLTEDFSIYDDFEHSTYDISFLDYLA